jgi:dienelactone hydrolase
VALSIGILVIALVVEVAFTAVCLTTRSSQPRLRSWIRLGLLGAFVLAALTPLIDWGSRWYLLAALLLIWAALGAWTLRGRRPDARPFSPTRSVLGAVGRLLLVLLAMTPAILFPQYTLPRATGAYKVALRSYTFTDAGRVESFTTAGEPRRVNVSCWYPEDGQGKYPLAVFSHGAFGMRGGNISTYTDLASNGYVACSIDHPYHSLLTVDVDGRRTMVDPGFFWEVIDFHNGKYDLAAEWALVKQWMALRVADMGFVVDSLTAQARNPGDDPVARRIDLEHIGLFGHSLGGATSAYLARVRGDVDAVIDLDGSLFGEFSDAADGSQVLNESTFPVPILIVYSDALGRKLDPGYDPDGRNPVNYIVATAPDAFKVHVPGNHFNVTDVPLISPVFASVIMTMAPNNGGAQVDDFAAMERTNQLVLAFFNAYLKGQGSFSAASTTADGGRAAAP